MAELTEDQKLEIVTMLACFRDTNAILDHFRDEHGLELTHKQVGAYDPNRSYYEAGERWRDVFDRQRKSYLEDVATVPIANQGFRLNLLNEQAALAFKNKQPALGAALLEQAAREVGGLMTNQRSLTVDDNRRARPSEMTPEDRRAAMAELIRQAMEKMAERKPPEPPLALP